MGGLGLYSATRTKEAAYWAAWADLLPVIHARAPALAQEFVTQLEHGPAAVAACLQQADQAGRHLDLHGWAHRPPWTSLIGDAAPPPPLADREPAWWRHGWQHPASVAVTTYHRQECVLPSLSPTHRALLRSQAGPGAGAWLLAVPSDPGTTLPLPAMNIALRRRLRLPLPVTAATCGVDGRGHGCGGPLDPYGDHALACPRSGALARRAPVVERAWVRVAREAIGADGRVVPQQWIASLNVPGVSSTDRRRLDLVIYGATPLGEALCCDATLVSALTRGGAPIPPEQRTMTLLPSPRRASENSGRTRSCSNEARSACWSSPLSSVVAGVGSAANSCASWLTIARAALALQCDPPPAADGCDVGGGY